MIRQLWTSEWVTYEGRYYQVRQARLYDVPDETIPLYMAAESPKSMEKAGRHGDGLISDSERVRKPEMRQAFNAGAQAAGKDPKRMPILAEHFVVVGGSKKHANRRNSGALSPKPGANLSTTPTRAPSNSKLKRKSVMSR